MRGKMHKDLTVPDLPIAFFDIFATCCDLAGVDITYQEIDAYNRITGSSLDGFDISILKDIDRARNMIFSGKTVTEVLKGFGYE